MPPLSTHPGVMVLLSSTSCIKGTGIDGDFDVAADKFTVAAAGKYCCRNIRCYGATLSNT